MLSVGVPNFKRMGLACFECVGAEPAPAAVPMTPRNDLIFNWIQTRTALSK